MKPTDNDFLDKVERRVGEIEQKSRAEVVVVIAAAASSYATTACVVAGALAFLVLTTILYSPWEFQPLSVLPNLLLVAGLGALLTVYTPLRRILTPARFQCDAVAKAARWAFFDQEVSATADRVGVLVFFSLLERRVEVLVDHGVARHVEGARWTPIRTACLAGSATDKILEVLDCCGEVLADRLPVQGERENELPNRPRLLDTVL